MSKKTLILYIPVIHKGYLDLLERLKGKVSGIFIIGEELLDELSIVKNDIAAIPPEKVKELLGKLGFESVSILSAENIDEVRGKDIILIQDELSRNLSEKYLKKEKVVFESVFLRWDKERILAEIPADIIKKSDDAFDVEMMGEAYKEAEKSGDWWRQIGAVLVSGDKIIARSYNQGAPEDNSPYQVGSERDFFKAGEKQEMSPTIHAEQKLIAEAARNGLKTDGAVLYLTHFPCPLCSKMIAWSRIRKLYFTEGASNLNGKRVMEAAGIDIIHIPQSLL